MAQLGPRDRALLLALGVVVLLLAGAGTIAASAVDADRPRQEVPDEFVEPRPGENVIWPYTSKRHAVEGRTLAINVLVHGDADRLRFYLTERADATWNETDAEEEIDPAEHEGVAATEQNGTVLDWTAARGAERYVYIHDRAFTVPGANASVRRPHWAVPFSLDRPRDGGGHWIDESYQVHDGTYFGTRYHLRVYESPYESDEWAAIQAHSDHWDWFRLRHTVDDAEGAQNRLESEFIGQPFVADVWRMYLHNDDRPHSDGWASVMALESADVDDSGPARTDSTAVARPRSGPGSLGSVTLIGFAVGVATAAVGGSRLRGIGHRPTDGETEHRRSDGEIGLGRTDGEIGLGRTDGEGGTDRSKSDGVPRRAHGGAGSGRQYRETGGERTAEGDEPLGPVRSALLGRLGQRQLAVLLRALAYGQLFASLFVLYLSIRAGGIAVETAFTDVAPKAIAAGLYPLLALGLPICAYAFGRPLAPVRAFAVAAVGIETAIVADYLYLDIAVLPIDVVVHRLGVAIALGLLAAGAAPRGSSLPTVNRWFAAGVLLWVFLLLAPLVGWL